MSMRRFLQGFLLLAGFSVSACTAILVPDVSGDGVNRCNVTADCPDIDDNRYEAVCTAGENQPDNSDQICSSDYAVVRCGDGVDLDNLMAAYEAADDAKANYGNCSEENLGKQGCGMPMGGCEAGLEANAEGICDVPGADIPAINAGDVGLSEIAGQDVADQFCRNFFCDERFVCDRDSSDPVCVVCNPNDPFGEGGCGTLYIDGAASSFYTDVESTGNCSGNRALSEVPFGDAPTGVGD